MTPKETTLLLLTVFFLINAHFEPINRVCVDFIWFSQEHSVSFHSLLNTSLFIGVTELRSAVLNRGLQMLSSWIGGSLLDPDDDDEGEDVVRTWCSDLE